MGALSNNVYLGTYCLIVILQIFCTALNGLVVVCFAKLKTLRKNQHLRLIFYLSISYSITAIAEAPYIIYMILNWDPELLDFDPQFILISSIPLPIQLKISATITIEIALSRNMALYFPTQFQKIGKTFFSEIMLATGVTLGIIDAVLWFVLSPPTHVHNCGTSGCFVSDRFRCYWGFSNMILGFIVVILCATFFIKINTVKNKTKTSSCHQLTRYKQASRTSTGILISSLFFLTLPSVCVGVLELYDYSVFRLVGPFYSASLMSSGICNGIIFIGCNSDVRRLMRKPRISLTQTVSGRIIVLEH